MTNGPHNIGQCHAVEGHLIEYRNIHEVSQGGPETGDLHIDSTQVCPGSRFGGPFLTFGGMLYVPRYKGGLISAGFILTEINLNSLSIRSVGTKKELIHLTRIENRRIFYFSDLTQTTEESMLLSG